MELSAHEFNGHPFVEGPRGHAFLTKPDEATWLLEACYAHNAARLLLYPENLTPHFFDLSSGEAGAVLQKLRNYQVRLAIVRTPALQMSSRFGELLIDEQRGPWLRLCDDRDTAQAWLCTA